MRIYLDNNATTEMDPEVFDAFVQSLSIYGNPSSVHFHGQQARAALAKARAQVAAFFRVKPKEIIFTASGTEANNLILRGVIGNDYRGHIITSNTEHSSVYNVIREFESLGCRVTYLPSGKKGAVLPEQVESAIEADTRLISLIGANNETGVKTDIEMIASIAERRGIPLMVDAVCVIGKEWFVMPKGVAFASVSGHKFHAPKGIGCAIVRDKYKLHPYLRGGPQEFGLRAGTENLPTIIGFAKALQRFEQEHIESIEKMRVLRDSFEKQLTERVQGIYINGTSERISNTSNILFSGIDGEALLIRLDLLGLSVSHGSACASGALEPSRVLLNMGLSHEEAASSIRFSLGRHTSQKDIDTAIELIVRSVAEQKAFSVLNGVDLV